MKKFIHSIIYTFIGIMLILGCTGKDSKSITSNKLISPDSLLNGRWVVQKIDGAEVVKENAGKDIPYLEFRLKDSVLSGFTGCNQISGKVIVTAEEIMFKEMSMTKMFCDDAKYEQNILSYVFNKSGLKYKIDNGELSIFKDESEVMILKKKD